LFVWGHTNYKNLLLAYIGLVIHWI